MENNHKLIYFKNIKYLRCLRRYIFALCAGFQFKFKFKNIKNIKDTFTDISLVYALN